MARGGEPAMNVKTRWPRTADAHSTVPETRRLVRKPDPACDASGVYPNVQSELAITAQKMRENPQRCRRDSKTRATCHKLRGEPAKSPRCPKNPAITATKLRKPGRESESFPNRACVVGNPRALSKNWRYAPARRPTCEALAVHPPFTENTKKCPSLDRLTRTASYCSIIDRARARREPRVLEANACHDRALTTRTREEYAKSP